MEGGSDSTSHSFEGIQLAAPASQVQDENELSDVKVAVDALEAEDKLWAREESACRMLDRVPEDRRIRVDFAGVHAFVPVLDVNEGGVKSFAKKVSKTFSLVREEPATKLILSGAFGGASPGELLALMGPSGSGKTTLLSILGGRIPKGVRVEGDILFNGMPMTKPVKRKMGYVTQDDLMYATLTVFETLYFAALLRLPKSMTRLEKKSRVNAVIESLGLEKCKDTIIGDAMMRGVSGGERKRASIGHELMIDPAIMMLDEPTSGLDSTSAMHLMKTLRKLAEGGRSIITSIHQPSSRLYQQLDSLMLLAEGQMMYYGDAKLVIGWFKAHGKPVPLGVNIADFALDLANDEISDGEKSGEETRKELVSLFLAYAGDEARGVTKEEDFTWSDEQEGRTLQSDTKHNALQEIRSTKHTSTTGEREEKWGAGYLEQLVILAIRNMRVQRFDSLSVQNLLNFLGIAIISGLLWWQVGTKDTLLSANDTAGLIFFVSIFVQFTAMFRSLFVFPSEFQMMIKERSSGMYKLSAFYFARTFSEIPLDCLLPSILVIVVYWMAGLKASFGAFISFWLAILLAVLSAQTMGLLVGASVTDPKTGTTICSLVMLTMMLTGGYYIRSIPSWLDWLKYTSFVFYTFRVLMKVEFTGRSFKDCGGLGVNPSGNATCLDDVDLDEALSMNVDPTKSVTADVFAIIAWLVGLRIILYYVLRHKTRS